MVGSQYLNSLAVGLKMATNYPAGRKFVHFVGFLALMVFLTFRYGLETVEAARVSDIRGTKHNLSGSPDGTAYTNQKSGSGTYPTRNIKATTETQLCVFCHTPHGASTAAKPLWNRKVADEGYTQSYVLYDSTTLDAKQVQGSLQQPGGSSKLCLSCHDGTVAIGNVNVLNGIKPTSNPTTNSTIATTGGPNMPVGSGAATGFTRNLGTDLTNDHPISISYNDTLANRDGELRTPSTNTTLIGVRTPTNKPKLKLEKTGAAGANLEQVQCATCHDPHIRETDTTVGNQKFLRLNRFQHQDPPSSSGFNAADNTGDIICLACHDKGGAAWAYSAHANSLVADEQYSDTHADRREFPRNLPVWKAACLNCHDTHSVAGSRRLLREGTDEGVSTAVSPKPGGTNKAALEEVCYQCHDGGTNGTLKVATNVPNIKTDFTTKTIRMPITTAAQGTSGGGGGNASEPHEINGNFSNDSAFIDCSTAGAKCGKDFVEPRSKLGRGNLQNRHAECTDCHNPHRVIRGKRGLPGALNSGNTSEALVNGASGGVHQHTESAITHTNVISGVLRGSWGVQPSYGSASFFALPTTYVVKRGDPGNANIADCHAGNKATCDAAGYVTREYQICLKCHSDYGFTDNNQFPSDSLGGRPSLGGTGLTAKDVSRTAGSYTTYTNQAREFQPPVGHQGEPVTTTDSGSGSGYSLNNHRSWHPVMDSTGRSGSARGGGTDISSRWRAPWNNAVGTQTMYCTDCHGSDTAAAGVIPDTGKPWGPHGSNNNFLLKAPWTTATGTGNTDHLCFRCHNSGPYTGSSEARTGFYITRGGKSKNKDGHKVHRDKVSGNIMRCNWCHVAVPHGWKNKALLVNLNDAGPEVNLPAGTEIANGSLPYSNGPYYRNAMLKVDVFAESGKWSIGDCGRPGTSEDAALTWMQNTCGGPP
jgi:hypothetical protein